MLPILRAMRTSIESFYMAQEVYPSKLEELDIDIKEFTNSCSSLGPAFQTGGCKANDRVNLFLNATTVGKECGPMFQFNSGPYRGAGFGLRSNQKFVCYENAAFVTEPKLFCEKVMGCKPTTVNSVYAVDLAYLCPDL